MGLTRWLTLGSLGELKQLPVELLFGCPSPVSVVASGCLMTALKGVSGRQRVTTVNDISQVLADLLFLGPNQLVQSAVEVRKGWFHFNVFFHGWRVY